MTRYLLDTNVVSELRRNKPHGAVVAWMDSLRDDQIFVSAVTMGELQAGVERTRRQDPQKAEEIEAWIELLWKSFAFLPMDVAEFRAWSQLMEGRSAALDLDAMIAASARVHGFTVATRNEKDFRHLGVAVLNPFKAT
jgi:toxin FitB